MLILKRRAGEKIVIDGNIIVTFCGCLGDGRAKVGVEAPKDVQVDRLEVHERKQQELAAIREGQTP